jgi:hypothetical protein
MPPREAWLLAIARPAGALCLTGWFRSGVKWIEVVKRQIADGDAPGNVRAV